MKSEKISLPLDHFPEQIRTYLERANFYDSSSHSAASVFYADTGYYLKIDQKGQLAQEATLAKWFEKQGLGVPVIHYLAADKDYLLTKEAKGKDALAFLQQPEELCQTMAALIHGDACLPNFILKDAATFSCFIDLGLAGLSDRHLDLYWAIWSLTYNLSDPQYAELFLDYYGRKDVDTDKLRLIAAFEAFS